MLHCSREQRCRWGICLCPSVNQLASLKSSTTHARTHVSCFVRLHPDYIFTAAVAPLGENFSASFETLSCTATYPKKHKARICGQVRNWEGLQVVPSERGRKWRIDKDDIEFIRMQRRQFIKSQKRWRKSVVIDRDFLQLKKALLLGISMYG